MRKYLVFILHLVYINHTAAYPCKKANTENSHNIWKQWNKWKKYVENGSESMQVSDRYKFILGKHCTFLVSQWINRSSPTYKAHSKAPYYYLKCSESSLFFYMSTGKESGRNPVLTLTSRFVHWFNGGNSDLG